MVHLPFESTAMLRTLAVGSAGGAVFWLLGLPLPWLSGAAAAVAGMALAGKPLGIPAKVREAAIMLLGLTMGATVTPETLALLPRWPATMLGLAGAMVSAMFASAKYLQYVHGLDPLTARFGSLPGGSSWVMALAIGSNCDPRRVAVIQLVRMMAIMLLLPTFLAIFGWDASGGAARRSDHEVRLDQLFCLVVLCSLSSLALNFLKIPASTMLGAMLAAAATYGSGLFDSKIPDWLMSSVLAVLGSALGATFAGTNVRLVIETIKAGLGSLFVASAVTLGWAWPLGRLLELPVTQVWLSFAPGGVETTTILALALGLDGAFVAAHHVVRMALLNLAGPWWLLSIKTDHPRPGDGSGQA